MILFTGFARERCKNSLNTLLEKTDPIDNGWRTKTTEKVREFIYKYDRKNFLIRDNYIVEFLRRPMSILPLITSEQAYPFHYTMLHIFYRLDRAVNPSVHLLNKNDFPDLYHLPSTLTLPETMTLISLHLRYFFSSYLNATTNILDNELMTKIMDFYKNPVPLNSYSLSQIISQLKEIKYPNNRNLWKDLAIKLFTINPHRLNFTGAKLKALRFRLLFSEKDISKWVLNEKDSHFLIDLENSINEPPLKAVKKLLKFYDVTDRTLFPFLDKHDPSFFDKMIAKEEIHINYLKTRPVHEKLNYFLDRANLKWEGMQHLINITESELFVFKNKLLEGSISNPLILLKIVGTINVELHRLGYHRNILHPEFFPKLFIPDTTDSKFANMIRLHIVYFIRYNNTSIDLLAKATGEHPSFISNLIFDAPDSKYSFFYGSDLQTLFKVAQLLFYDENTSLFDLLDLQNINILPELES